MTFSVNGALIFQTVPKWRQEGLRFIKETATPQIDFAKVEQSDSSAVALLLSWLRHAKALGKTLKFSNVPQQLLDVAQVCGVLFLIQQESHNNG